MPPAYGLLFARSLAYTWASLIAKLRLALREQSPPAAGTEKDHVNCVVPLKKKQGPANCLRLLQKTIRLALWCAHVSAAGDHAAFSFMLFTFLGQTERFSRKICLVTLRCSGDSAMRIFLYMPLCKCILQSENTSSLESVTIVLRLIQSVKRKGKHLASLLQSVNKH